jgi:hypothetical protein
MSKQVLAIVLMGIGWLAGLGGRAGPTPPRVGAAGDSAPAIQLELVGQLGGPSFALAVRGDRAFVGLGRRLAVLDVGDPSRIHEVGEYRLSSPAATMVIDGDVAYLAEEEDILHVLDLSRPEAPRRIGGLGDGWRWPSAMVRHTGTLYLAYGQGLQIIDIADPTAPRRLGFVGSDQWLADLAYASPYVYAATGEGGVAVFDVSIPSVPRLLRRIDVGGRATALVVGSGYAVVAVDPPEETCWDGSPSSGRGRPPEVICLLVLDLRDTSRPVPVGRLAYLIDDSNSSEVPPGGLRLQGDRLLVASSNRDERFDRYGALHVVDLQHLDRPHIVSQLSGLPAPAELLLATDRVYLAIESGGLAAVDFDAAGAPWLAGSLRAPRHLSSIAQAGGHVFLGDHGRPGFVAVDASEPARPHEVGFVRFGNDGRGSDRIQDLAVLGTQLYAASDLLGLEIRDLSDPASMPRRANIAAGIARSVAVAPGHAFVGSAEGTLQVFDVATPERPRPVGRLELGPGSIWDLAKCGDFVYAAVYRADDASVKVVSVADPANPRLLGGIAPKAGAWGLACQGDRLFVTGQWGELSVIDVSDAGAPRELGAVDAYGTSGAIALAGGYAFVSHLIIETVDGWGVNARELLAIDISDPRRPRVVATLALPREPTAMTANWPWLYLADDQEGLQIVEIRGVPTDDVEPTPTPQPSPTGTPTAPEPRLWSLFLPAALRLIGP